MNLRSRLLNKFRSKKLKGGNKIFCIGHNKTGTTSVESALFDLGYKIGDQAKALSFLEDYQNNSFERLLQFCDGADAFQDAPFSYQGTFKVLDEHFPHAKFILTVRKNSHVWYDSLVRFHSQLITKNKRIPTSKDLKSFKRNSKRSIWDNFLLRYPMISESDPYNKEILIEYYDVHNQSVIDHFKGKKNLLVIDLSDGDSYIEFCDFIEERPLYPIFPWENRSE